MPAERRAHPLLERGLGHRRRAVGLRRALLAGDIALTNEALQQIGDARVRQLPAGEALHQKARQPVGAQWRLVLEQEAQERPTQRRSSAPRYGRDPAPCIRTCIECAHRSPQLTD